MSSFERGDQFLSVLRSNPTDSPALPAGPACPSWRESGHLAGSSKRVFASISANYHFQKQNEFLIYWGSNRAGRRPTTEFRRPVSPTGTTASNQVVVDETQIRLDGWRHQLFASVASETNGILHVELSQTQALALTKLFLDGLVAKHSIETKTIVVDDAHHLVFAPVQVGLQYRTI